MRKFIWTWLLVMMFGGLWLGGKAHATGLSDLKFGQYQIADSQWDTGACLYTTTCNIYSTNPGTAYKVPWWSGQISWASGDYIAFTATGDNTNPWNAVQYNSSGQQKATMGTGHIINMGTDFFFFVGNDNDTGQLFSMTSGLSSSSGMTWTGTLNPTVAQVNTLAANGSTTPLGAGQVKQAGPPPPNPTKIYRQYVINGAGVYIVNVWPTSYNSPSAEQAPNAFDNNVNTKYLNFDKYNSGVTVQLNSGRVVTGFTLTTANDYSGRDPTSYRLYGSNDGVNWTLVQAGSLSLPDSRYTESDVISVTNSNAYAYYYIMFPTTKAGDGCGQDCNSMQIAGIQFIYDSNSTVTSTAVNPNSTPSDPVQSGIINGNGTVPPTVEGGTITQTNAPSNQTLGSGSTYTASQTGVDIQSRINSWNNTNQQYNNMLYIDQVGQSNTIDITQSGTKNRIDFTMNGNNNIVDNTQTGNNYLKIDVPGWGNYIVTNQSNSAGSNYAETKIQGNGNTVNHTQTGNANQMLSSTITGDINTVTTNQSGQAGHYAESKITGNWNSVSITQTGNTANKATVDVTNNGGAASVDIQQSGGKSINIIQGCANPAGCTTIVRQ